MAEKSKEERQEEFYQLPKEEQQRLVEEAHEEANIMQEKIRSGEAKDYQQAEKLIEKGDNQPKKELKKEWVEAIKQYTHGSGSKELNKSLWQGKELSPELEALDKNLCELFDKSGRAVRWEELCHGSDHKLNPGEEVNWPGWMSCSTNWDGASIFGKHYYLVINAIALDIRDISAADQSLHHEAEILVRKGQKFLVGEPKEVEYLGYDSYWGDYENRSLTYTPLYCIDNK